MIRTEADAADLNRGEGHAAAEELRIRALVFAHGMLPNQFFTHVTAAVLWGLPLPLALLRDAFGQPRPLDIGVLGPLRHPRHAGVMGHQVTRTRARALSHIPGSEYE